MTLAPVERVKLRVPPAGYEPGIDWAEAARHLECPSGYFVVEAHGCPERYRGLELSAPGEVRWDTATCLASGVEGVEPGDCVLVARRAGKWVLGFSAGDYAAKEVVLFLGCGSVLPSKYTRGTPEDFVYGVWDLERKRIKSLLGHYVLLRRPAQIERTAGGIWLPDDERRRDQTRAEVVMTGPRCTWAREGDVVAYQASTLQELWFEDEPELAIVDERNLLARICE